MNAHFYNQLAASALFGCDSARHGAAHVSADSACHPEALVTTGVASGFAVLDAFLPWRGWPMGAMTEIMTDSLDNSALTLLLPAMARLSREKRRILCIGAPHYPSTVALALSGIEPACITHINPSSISGNIEENLCSSELALNAGLHSMVLLWSRPDTNYSTQDLLRLHQASVGQKTMLIHFRGASCMSQPSPAWLRFGLAADDSHIRLQVLKCRGRLLSRPLITLDREAVRARLGEHAWHLHDGHITR